MPKILISTVPFCSLDSKPIELLKTAGLEFHFNPIGRKFKEAELRDIISDYDAIIAGTEPITDKVMENASKLKLISRVGIGLDSVDLWAARKRGIKVSYTPEAPSKAVADLTLGLMLSLLRQIHISNSQLKLGSWHRFFGRRLGEVKIGLIGLGRIGSEVLSRLQGFQPGPILCNDLEPKQDLSKKYKVEWVDKETLYREADLISLHIPLTSKTRGMISKKEISLMKKDVLLLNTARGGIIHEADLYEALKLERIGGAAIDVFEEEPYDGPLKEIEKCLLTAHMGSMSIDCRNLMELEATQEVLRFFSGENLKSEVPENEYENQRET